MRNRAGIIQRFPTGTDEVEYSNVTKTESRMGCGFGRGGHRPGDIPHPPQEASVIKRNSTKQNNTTYPYLISSIDVVKPPDIFKKCWTVYIQYIYAGISAVQLVN
jgi:hypothetical protein